jgi:MerR family mercuric resistance operon transcriptional regulator
MGPVVTPDASGKARPLVTKERAASGPLIQIGALAERTRCNIETIRFYEKIGVLPEPVRTGGGTRIYGPAHVSRLTFIRRTRELGFTLDEVRALLRLADERDRPCGEVKSLAAAHLADVKAKIADLRAMQAALADLIVQCETGNGTDCPLIEALSHP